MDTVPVAEEKAAPEVATKRSFKDYITSIPTRYKEFREQRNNSLE
jgi:hypothetical protein